MNSRRVCLKAVCVGTIGGLMLSVAASINTFAASGSVHLTNDMVRSSKPILKTTENVGGGVWDYGTCIDGDRKKCWSNYSHPTNRHGSRARCGTDDSTKIVVDPGQTSFASAHSAPWDFQAPTHANWDNEC